MARGLGKHSPIQLRLSRDNYEALIDRHGQWVRWLRGDRCPCALSNGRADPQCTRCGGDGSKYAFAEEKTLHDQRARAVAEDLIDLGCERGEALAVLSITHAGRSYAVGELVDGRYVSYSGTPVLRKSDDVRVSYTSALARVVRSAMEYLGNDTFAMTEHGIPTAYGTVWGDITAVEWIRNETKDETYTIKAYYRNIVEIDTPAQTPEADDIVMAELTYVRPLKLAVLSQIHRKEDRLRLEEMKGECLLVFPDEYPISEGDAATLLVGTQLVKRVLSRGSTAYDRLPEFYVADVLTIETTDNTYEKGADFMLFDRNRIKWVGSSPTAGTSMYVLFSFHPTYKVLREFPMVRSSENTRFPRRVGLQLLNLGGKSGEGV